MKKPSKKQPKSSASEKSPINTLSNDKKGLASSKNTSKKPINKIIKKEIMKRDTVKTENNEIVTLSEEISSNGQDIKFNKNSDEVEEKSSSVSKKRKRSDTGHINHTNSKLDPEYRLDIKKKWEIARRINISPEERNKSINSLFELVRGNVPGLLFKNDTSRVIETCLKYGSKEQRNIIASELEGRLLEASKNKYAKYIVCKLMKFCPEYRSKMLTEFKGQVKKLFLHTEARNVLLEVYELSNANQRSSLLQEFYGPEFTLFKRTENLNIKDLIAEDPSKKDRILKNLFQTIQHIINKQESFNYIIMHRILLEYFTYADDHKIKEVIEAICEHIPLFLHTYEGSQVAMLCFSYGSVKGRKVMLKSLKEYITKICKEEYGYLVLLRALDVVDDT
ncbi:8832_t:CDS:2, partial [Dentiscutata erythropus]